MKQQSRKTVLFIVEGASDKNALEMIFKRIYRQNRQIEFRFTQGDISSDWNITVSNVEDRINSVVLQFLNDSKLRRSDLYQIIQIFDMDGAFIDEADIHTGLSGKIMYYPNEIQCRDITKVKERNTHKSQILRYLLQVDQIKGTSYEMYFMSCNLDHALYDQQNLDDERKVEYADAFYEQFAGTEPVFIAFLKSDVANGVPDSYPDSWRYIQEGRHSLERHSNLHIYFDKHPVL